MGNDFPVDSQKKDTRGCLETFNWEISLGNACATATEYSAWWTSMQSSCRSPCLFLQSLTRGGGGPNHGGGKWTGPANEKLEVLPSKERLQSSC